MQVPKSPTIKKIKIKQELSPKRLKEGYEALESTVDAGGSLDASDWESD